MWGKFFKSAYGIGAYPAILVANDFIDNYRQENK